MPEVHPPGTVRRPTRRAPRAVTSATYDTPHDCPTCERRASHMLVDDRGVTSQPCGCLRPRATSTRRTR